MFDNPKKPERNFLYLRTKNFLKSLLFGFCIDFQFGLLIK